MIQNIGIYHSSPTCCYACLIHLQNAGITETEEQEIKVLTKLKETVDKQREELRSLKHELSQKAVDCDAVSGL